MTIFLKPYENYKQIGGHGFATLIRNKPFDPKNPFRMVGKTNRKVNFNFFLTLGDL